MTHVPLCKRVVLCVACFSVFKKKKKQLGLDDIAENVIMIKKTNII